MHARTLSNSRVNMEPFSSELIVYIDGFYYVKAARAKFVTLFTEVVYSSE